MNLYKCELCSLSFNNEVQYKQHLAGKKHIKLECVKEERENSARRSVFVSGLKKNTFLKHLEEHFEKFGKINKTIVDKEKNAYAIIEFESETSVKQALLEDNHEINGKKAKVIERETKQFQSKRVSKMDKKKELIEKAKNDAIALNSILQKCISFEDQVDKLVEYLKLPQDELETRERVSNELNDIFVKIFPATLVSIIGSTKNGLACRGSDMDLTLLFDEYPSLNRLKQVKISKYIVNKDNSASESSNGGEEDMIDFDVETEYEQMEQKVKEKNNNDYYSASMFEQKCKDLLNLEQDEQIIIVTKLLQRNANDLQDIRNVKQARCPVTKFIYEPLKLNCELSLNNYLAIENTELICVFLKLESNLTRLIFVIRYWAKQKELYGQMKFNSYTLIWLIIFYLQQIKQLPSVEYLAKIKSDDTKLMHGWNTSFESNVDKIQFGKDSIGFTQLLRGFFEFYALFAYDSCVISVRQGSCESVTSTALCKCNQINTQDPFDLSHNLSVNISEKTLDKFKSECFKSYELLKHCLTPKKNSNKCWGLSILLTKKTLELQKPNLKCDISSSLSEQHYAILKLKEPLRDDLKEIKFFIDLLKSGLLFDDLNKVDSNQGKMKRKRAPVLNQICEKVDTMGIKSSPKRLRVDSEKFVAIDNIENQNEASIISNKQPTYLAKVTKNTWLGRRNIKRDLLKLNQYANFIQFEKMVSERLLEKNDSESINFTFYMTFLTSESDKDCLKIKFELFGDSYNQHDLVNFTTLVHFLDVYLNNSIENIYLSE